MKKIIALLSVFLLTSTSSFARGDKTKFNEKPSIEISTVVEKSAKNSKEMIMKDDPQTYWVSKKPLLKMEDFTHASVTLTEGQIVLNLGLNKAAGKKIRKFSEKNVGKKLAFIVNGELKKVPEIKDPILGDGILVGPLEKKEAEKLAQFVNKE